MRLSSKIISGSKSSDKSKEISMKKLLLAFAIWFALSGVAMAVVNINTATKEELTSLKGVGDKRAQEIIDYRKKNGNFKSIDELEKVPGIGPGLMKQIRPEVTVSGKTSTTKAGDTDKSKSATAKPTEAPKGDAMKSTTTEKSKAEEKKIEKK
jgi:competence protein ComEA